MGPERQRMDRGHGGNRQRAVKMREQRAAARLLPPQCIAKRLRLGAKVRHPLHVDAAVRDRFGKLYRRLAANVLRSNDPRYWEETPRGCLAAVIVLRRRIF